MRKNISKNNKKRLICTVIVGAMLCAGAAFGVTKYVNRDAAGNDGTDTSIVNTQGQSGDVAKADQTVYMTDFQKESAQKEAEIVADKVEDKKDTLTADQGLYAPDSIVLADTTKEEAERIAEKLGADVRLTDDGSFAVLYLPEGMTIDDVYNNDEYSQEITEMTPDYYVSVSALNQELALNPTGDKSKSETTTYSEDSQPVSKVTKARPDYAANDPDFSNQQYLDYINLKNTWNTTKGSGVTVAVIDSGIDTDHPEFAGRISEKSYNASEDKIVKDYDMSVIEDEQGHGTEVAGVLAASMDNNEGIVGVAPGVELLVIKCNVTENGEFVRGSDAVFGLAYAIEADVDVINMSFASYEDMYSKYTELAVDSDIICVAAAGNDGSNMPMYPASLDSVIAVGAYDTDNETITDYSNYGENVDILAPGTTYTTAIGGEYTIVSGTSMSAPVAAGAAALYRSAFGKTEFTDMKQLFEASSVDIGIAGEDYYHGFGEVDVYALVCEEKGKITYDMMTDEIANQTQIFVKGHTVQTMPEPEREYLVFDGWYFDPTCEDVCELYTNVFSADITLYASWVNEDDGTAFNYAENSDGTMRITAYTGKRRYVTVPAEINGAVVTEIGENAFADNMRIRSVSLPDSVRNIGARAFVNCVYIRSINIPDAVITINEEAFMGCVRMNAVNLSENSSLKTIGDRAFSMAGISEFRIPVGLISLGNRVFYGSTAIRKIKVADGNGSYMVKNSALYDNTGDELIYYPSGLSGKYIVDSSTITISDAAFAYSRCEEVVMSKGVISIGKEGFTHSRIEKITFPESLSSMGESICRNCVRLSDVIFAAKIKLSSIADGAFYGTSNLKNIVIPDSINKIGVEAFYNSEITEVTWGKNSKLKKIGVSAFAYTRIKSISIPDEVESIEEGAFEADHFLQKVNFGKASKCTKIGSESFAKTDKLKEFTIPNNVTSLGEKALYRSGISKIVIGAKIANIGSGVFAACHNLSDITVDDNNQKYASYNGVLYNKTKTVLIQYPAARTGRYTTAKTTKSISGYAFSGASKLTDIVLNSGMTRIGTHAFEYCNKMQTPTLPVTLTQIDSYAFAECSRMNKKLIIPKNVKSIGYNTFHNDFALSEIEIEAESVLTRIGSGAFAYCGIENFTIPRSVSTISQEVFKGCSKLITVTFEADSKVEKLPAWIFAEAKNLRRITFETGSSLKIIEARACEELPSLEVIDFKGCKQLTTIGNYAFKTCKSLGNITLPASVSTIGRYAFYGCSKMNKLNLPKKVSKIGRYAFTKTNSIKLYFMVSVLPLGLETNWDYGIGEYYVGHSKLYENKDWVYVVAGDGNASIIKYKGSASEIILDKIDGHKVTSIGGEAFKDNTTLTKITLPDTLTGIYKYAFSGTISLSEIQIPNNVVIIDSNAFSGSGVERVLFGVSSKLTSIGVGAFENTKRLSEVSIPSGVESLKDRTFYNSGIQRINLPADLKNIGKETFSKSKLISILIPAGVTEIGYSAFKDVESLGEVSFSASDTALMIRDEVFYNTSIKNITISANVKYIGNLCFGKCKKLTQIDVSTENDGYASLGGVLYNKDYTKLLTCPAGKTGSYTVPDSVNKFSTGAFEGSELSEVIIPDESKLLTIGYRAFLGCSNLQHITIPDSVLSIDFYAFAYCDNLEQVDIDVNSQLGGIYEGSFYNCKSLNNIVIPNCVNEISDYAFYGCTALKNVTISENSSLKGVFDHAFEYSGIEQFTMPTGMLEIGACAFRGAKMKTITFNEDIQEIGTYAFADSELTDMDILEVPNSVVYIGEGAFSGSVNNLKELRLPFLGATADYDGVYENLVYVLGNNLRQYDIQKISVMSGDILGSGAFKDLQASEIYIPKTIKIINNETFSGCKKLSEIYLSDSIQEIEYRAFERCISLNSIHIPDSVTKMGYEVFNGCENLQNVYISKNCEALSSEVFGNCISLTNIYVPKKVSAISRDAFQGCNKLESIIVDNDNRYYKSVDGILYDFNMTEILYVPKMTSGTIFIPDGVKKIQSRAFEDCRKIKEVVIPDSVTEIGTAAFYDCISMQKVVFGEGIQLIGYRAFKRSGIVEAIIPDSVVEIRSGSFGYCKKLQKVKLSNNVKKISLSTFSNDPVLFDVTLGDSVEEIEEEAFSGCKKLQTIKLTDNVKSIGKGAFKSCNRLSYIYINKNVKSIGDGAFSFCNNMKNIVVDDNNPYFYSMDGILYDKNVTRILFIPPAISGKVVIPDGIKNIESGLFTSHKNVTNVVFPETLETIGDSAFSYCSGIKEITIPDNVNMLGKSAFESCVNLKKIKLGKRLKQIGDSAFNSCSSLTSIEFNDALNSVGSLAFGGCESLDNIYLPESVVTIGAYAFSSCTNLQHIVFGTSITQIGRDILQNTSYARNMSNYHDGILYAGHYAISEDPNYNFDKITCIRILDGTILIANGIDGSPSIKKIIMPDSLRYISGTNFFKCTNLKYVRWSKNLQKFESGAFANTNIQSLVLGDRCKFDGYGFEGYEGLKYYKVDSNDTEYILDDYLYDKIITYIGVYGCDYYHYDFSNNPQNIVFENESQIKRSYIQGKGVNIFTREERSTGLLNRFSKNNNVYYSGEWNMATFYVDGVIVKMLPIKKSAMVQAPAENEVEDVLPEGATLLGWDIDGDGKADDVPATLSGDLNAHAVYDSPIKSLVMKDSITIEIGETQTISVTVEPYGYKQNDKLIWESSDDSIVKVSDGHINGISEGKAKIKAILADNPDIYTECDVTVIEKTYGIKLTESKKTIKVGESYTLVPELVMPDDDLNSTAFTSDHEIIATVDENGVITAIAPGSAKITVTHGDYNAVFTVTVDQPMTNVVISMTETELNVGTSLKLSTTFEPADTTDDRLVFWYSKDSSIADVDVEGTVTAIAPGVVDICGVVGRFKISCKVTVKAPLERILLNTTTGTLRLDKTKQLEVIYFPSNTTDDRNVIWSSSEPDIASVDENGLVTGLKNGKTVITGTVGSHTASYTVSVIGIRDTNTGITVTNSDDTEMSEKTTLKVDKITDSDVNDSYGDLTKHLSVDENGQLYNLYVYDITIMDDGEIVQPDKKVDVDIPIPDGGADSGMGIYRFEKDGTMTDMKPDSVDGCYRFQTEHFSVYCVAVPTNIYQAAKVQLGSNTVGICGIGNTKLINAKVIPEQAVNRDLSYISNNEKIVMVDKKGKLTAISAGTTTVTVKSAVQGVEAKVKVVVSDSHTWNTGTITKQPTYTAKGIRTYTCTVCKETKKEDIPALKRTDITKATSKIKITGIENKIYNGKTQTQTALVITANGKKLQNGTDYTVTYKNNKNIGTATFAIIGKNAYVGTIKKTFAIKTAVGKVYTGTYKYKITSAKTNGTGTVSIIGSAYAKTNKKFTTLKVADTVTIGGVKFKITRIETKAFMGYQYLKNVVIGSNVTSIGDYAFYKCPRLETVTVGKNVKTIGTKVFYGCKSFRAMKVLSSKLTKVGASTFAGIKANATFALPKKYYNSYSKMIKKAGAPKKAVYKKF